MRRNSRQSERHPRRFLAHSEKLESRLALSGPTFVVTSNANAGDGTLRTAILDADRVPVSTIDFNIKQGPSTIIVLDPLPPITSTVTIDGTSQPSYSGTPLVTVNGSGVASPGTGFAFVQNSSGSVIRGLAVTGFNSAAIMVAGASNITIGGAAGGQGNVISSNFQGIAISESGGNNDAPSAGTAGITVEGNFIGTDAAGKVAQPNVYGVFISAANNNTIGGSLVADRNIISGNTTAGIVIVGATGNTVAGNYIGANAAGSSALANGTGVEINGNATDNTVGGSTTAGRNLISGNTTAGIAISGIGTAANLVAGNDIGLDFTGQTSLANGIGIVISGGTTTTIGGTTAGAGNVISGNLTTGIALSGGSVNGTLIEGNEIGTDPTGARDIANSTGVAISGGASGNSIGGTTPAARNLISGNTTAGITIADAGSSANLIIGDFVGTDASGQKALANGIGVLSSGGTATTIGGTNAGAGNVISGNTTAGVELSSTAASGTLIVGNEIGTNPSGTAAVVRFDQLDLVAARQNAGIAIIGAQASTIGGTTVQAGNLISGNYVGMLLASTTTSGSPNLVLGNLIGTDASGQNSVDNVVGVYINGGSGNQVGGTISGAANVISGNRSVGVEIYGAGSTANLIQGNIIGLAADGRSAFRGSNGLFVQSVGVFIQAASGNVIGGSGAGMGNVITGNDSAGVFILSLAGTSQSNSVQGNFIGSGANGGPGPGNDGYGILLDNAPNNPIGRTGSAANQFGRNGIADIRRYSGPQTASLLPVSSETSAVHATAHPKGPVRHVRRKVSAVRMKHFKHPGSAR
jgi:hypothetical protein